MIAIDDRAAPTVRTAPDFVVPAGATDCHVHCYLDPAQYPMVGDRLYAPPVATGDDLLRFQRALRMDRAVIVTPTVYGLDNSATIHAMAQCGSERVRAVAVIDAGTRSSEIDRLHTLGFRGARVIVGLAPDTDLAPVLARFDAVAARLGGRGWHIQLYGSLPLLMRMRGALERSPVSIVLDHFAGVSAVLGVDQPGFATILDWVRGGHAYVKLSGVFYSADAADDYAVIKPFVRALVAANPERLLWGSDWPHPGLAHVGRSATDGAGDAAVAVDDGRMLNLLARWIDDPAILTRILVDNPARLYDF